MNTNLKTLNYFSLSLISEMKLNQIIISILLLFVYSFGFAHSMMPHDHGFLAEHQPETHNHEHHKHTSDSVKNTAHIHHNDHCDEGVIDLILCVINDFDNHNHDCEIEHLNTKNSKRVASRSNFNPNHFSNSNQISIKIIIDTYREKNNFTPYCDIYKGLSQYNSPLRGPPIL